MRRLQMLNETIHVNHWTRRQRILRPHKDVLDKCRRHDTQGDFTVYAAEGKIVNFISKGRNVRALGGVHIDGDHVCSVEVEVGCQLKREWRVAAFVLSQSHSVEPDCGSGHHALEVDKDAFTSRFGRKLEAAAVERDKFVSLFIETMPWERDVRVRDHDRVKLGVVEIFGVAAFDKSSAITPLSIHGKNESSMGR